MANRVRRNINRHSTIRKVDYFIAFILSFMIVFTWQLYRSPIAIPFLKPYIIQALNYNEDEYVVSLDSVNLELVRSIQPIKIIAKEVVYKKKDESLVVKAPRTTVSFSVRALIRGIISPSSVIFDEPSVQLYTQYTVPEDDEDGQGAEKSINERKIGYYLKTFNKFLKDFNSNDLSYAESYIDLIKINNAEFEFHEIGQGRYWSFGEANFKFERKETDIDLSFEGSYMLQDSIIPFSIGINYETTSKKIDMDFGFSDLIPSDLLSSIVLDTDTTDIYELTTPISGSISTRIDFEEMLKNRKNISKSLDTAVEKLDFQIEAGKGYLAFSKDEKYNYNISSLFLKGNVHSGLDTISIRKSKLNLDNEEAEISLDIKGFKNLLLKSSIKDLKVSLITEINKFQLELLSRYWPRYIAEPAWAWCRDGLYEGIVTNAKFQFDFGYDNKIKKIVFQNLTGVGDVSEASLNYLEGMYHAKNVHGHAVFSNDRIDIRVDKGIANGVDVSKGRVLLYDLDKDDNFISVQLTGKSSIFDALNLIDTDPFHFASEMGISPSTISGDAITTLDLNFELKQSLTAEEVKVSVVSDLSDVLITDVIKDMPIKGNKLRLDVNNQRLKLDGSVVVDDVSFNLSWLKEFNDKEYENKYEFSFVLDDVLRKKYVKDVDILQEPYILGDALVKASATEDKNKTIKIALDVDLEKTEIDYDFAGFSKKQGEVGSLTGNVEFVNSKISLLDNIHLKKEDFEVMTDFKFNTNGELILIDVSKIKGHRIDARGKVEIEHKSKDDKYVKINISGQSYDISWLLDKKDKSDKDSWAKIKENEELKEVEKISKKDTSFDDVPNMDVFIAVESLWTNPTVPITNFAGSAKFVKGLGVNEVKLIGNYSNKKEDKIIFNYIPHNDGEHKVEISSTNAGSTLKALRIYDDMEDGDLEILAISDKDKQLVGHAKIRNFSIKNNRVLYKMLSVMSFTGFVDMLKGDGIAFSHFDAPFDFKNGRLTLEDSKAFGNVVGITTSGYYDFDRDYISMKGMVAPAYTVNKFLGNIPIVGNLLSGKDGTIFATSYRIKGQTDEAEVKANPLSTIPPNSLKELFSSE